MIQGLRSLLVAVALAPSLAQAMEPIQVGSHSYYVQGVAGLGSRENRNFISNAGFVVTPAGVVVFDALGSPPLARELVAAIRGITSAPIVRVVVSHYHADHIYGLQELKAAGGEIWAQRLGREYLNSETAQQRLEVSRKDLAPYIDAATHLVAADHWIAADEEFNLGGIRFRVLHAGPAHTPEDLILYVVDDGVLFAGDLAFRGRIPYVGTADSRSWIRSLDRLLALAPKVLVPGHGPASHDALSDIRLTRDYLLFLREAMGKAAQELEPFEDAYRRTDWSRFEALPLFGAANRINAYNTYLLMQSE